MKILTLFQPAPYGGAPGSQSASQSWEAEDFRVDLVGPGTMFKITFKGGNSSGHDYAGAMLYPGMFPFMIREKTR